MLTCSHLIMKKRFANLIANLMLLILLVISTAISHSAVTWVTQTSSSNNDFLSYEQ